jgi:cysteine synthase A
MGRKYENILETVGNTPIVRIGKLAPKGINLFVKIEAFNPLGSVKDRLALRIIEEAEKSGALKPAKPLSRPPAAIPVSGLPWSAPKKVIH